MIGSLKIEFPTNPASPNRIIVFRNVIDEKVEDTAVAVHSDGFDILAADVHHRAHSWHQTGRPRGVVGYLSHRFRQVVEADPSVARAVYPCDIVTVAPRRSAALTSMPAATSQGFQPAGSI